MMKIVGINQIENDKRQSIPKGPGVYAFWWAGDRSKLLSGNCEISLKGPGGEWGKIVWSDWWPQELEYPCLYVGRSTNLRQRYSWHLLLNRSGRLHDIKKDNRKVKPCTTSCQVRYGIEHVFRDDDPIELMMGNIAFSYIDWFPEDNAIAERFYLEDRLIGQWRPWFNVDSER